ncbi:MAG: helix-turn-helix domain-containing protein [Prevotellaceae bacterium]|nr:helix-turn-helix domain-containing protein [Prevotellaceae bacterium]
MQNVAIRFGNELKTLVFAVPADEKRLQERIAAAIKYFSEILETVSSELKKSPAISDSKTNASQYNDDLAKVFYLLEERLHVFKNIKDEFTVEQYFTAKGTFVAPAFQVNAFAGANTSKKTDARFPILFYRLADCRRSICEKAGIPLYTVVSTQGLTEVATFLPQTANDLLKLSGFGPSNISKYGQQFLDIVRQYCDEHDLDSLMSEKIVSKSKKAGKYSVKQSKPAPKTDSKKITLDMYKQGLTVDEIARQRNYATSTIKVHLAHYVKLKELPLNDFVTPAQQAQIQELLKTTTSFSDIYTALKGEVGYTEIGMTVSLATEENSER